MRVSILRLWRREWDQLMDESTAICLKFQNHWRSQKLLWGIINEKWDHMNEAKRNWKTMINQWGNQKENKGKASRYLVYKEKLLAKIDQTIW